MTRHSPSDGSPIHPVAHGFRAAATRFEHGRPGYSAAIVGHIVEVLQITTRSTVVDLGAGTGKLTRALTPTGARIIAVEPVSEMFHELVAAVPGVPVLGAVAEALPLMTGCVDALVAAQSWHWFDPCWPGDPGRSGSSRRRVASAARGRSAVATAAATHLPADLDGLAGSRRRQSVVHELPCRPPGGDPSDHSG